MFVLVDLKKLKTHQQLNKIKLNIQTAFLKINYIPKHAYSFIYKFDFFVKCLIS